MTSYNREKYIAEAIESVLASTYANFELIVVDDGSKDNTVKIAKDFETTDSRVKVYVNEKNLGDYNNRNKAAGYANGKYLKYLDSDDIIYAHSIELMVKAMEQFSEAAYGFSFYGVQNDAFIFPKLYTPYEAYAEHFLGNSFFYAGPGGSIIRKDFFEEIKGFSGKRYIGDTELWMKMSGKYPCVLFWPGLIWWRKHDVQENKIERTAIQSIAVKHELVISMLTQNDCPLNKQQISIAVNNANRLYARRIYNCLLKIKFQQAFILYKNSRLPLHVFITALIPVNKIKKILNVI